MYTMNEERLNVLALVTINKDELGYDNVEQELILTSFVKKNLIRK